MKIQILLAFALLLSLNLPAQFSCGSYSKKSKAKNASEIVAIDRFNNAYTKSEISIEIQKSALEIQAGYFKLFIDDDLASIPTANHPNNGDDLTNVITQVFEDVSQIINQRSNEISCGDQIPQKTANILIGLDVCGTDDDCENATSAIAGVGSPLYEKYLFLHEQECSYLSESKVWCKINTQVEINPLSFDGLLNINIENPDIAFGLDLNNPPAADKIDLYSVVLHEVLHVLGFASRFDNDGDAQEVSIFNTRFYSMYDTQLKVVDSYQPNGQSDNVQDLLVSDCASNCYELSSAIDDFPTLVLENCGSNMPSIVIGNNAIAPLAGGSADIANALSHLNEACNGSNEDFVMDANIQKGDDERTISQSELEILCALGYDVNGISCSSSFVFASLVNSSSFLNQLAIPYFNSCCDEKFYTEVNIPLVFSTDALLCNSLSDGLLSYEVTELQIVEGLNDNSTLTDLGNGDFEFSAPDERLYQLIYTLTDEHCHQSSSVLQINVHAKRDSCILEDRCENLICNGDYEDYEKTNYINYQSGFDNHFLFDNAYQNSIDICEDGSNKLSSLANIDHPEGQLIVLQEPLTAGCSVKFIVDLASRDDNIGLYNITGSEFKPCYPTENLVIQQCNSFGDDAILTTCDESNYVPYCLVKDAEVTNLHSGVICSDPNVNWDTYEWEIEHTGDTEINYLVIHNTQSNSVIWMDNLIVQQSCPPSHTVDLLEDKLTLLETNILEIEVCFDDAGDFDFDGADIVLTALENPAYEILDLGDFVDGMAVVSGLDENNCVSLFIHILPTMVGEFDLSISTNVEELCSSKDYDFAISISDINNVDNFGSLEIPSGSIITYYNLLGQTIKQSPISSKDEIYKLIHYQNVSEIQVYLISSENRVIAQGKLLSQGY